VGERTERETAYFALLRAREELSALQRYERAPRAMSCTSDPARRSARRQALRTAVPERMRRVLRASDGELAEVMQRREALVEDELARLPARIEAAEAFVAECERHHDVLGGA
jgi:hypothetical protein